MKQFWTLLAFVNIFVLTSFFQIYHASVVANLQTPGEKWIRNVTNSTDDDAVQLQWSLLNGMFFGGTLCGLAVTGTIADKLGRIKTNLIGSISICVGTLMMGLNLIGAASIVPIILGRALIGFGLGLNLIATSLWISESSPLSRRGFYGCFEQLGLSLGRLLSAVLTLPILMGTDELWLYVLPLAGLFALPYVVLYPLVPNSPRWLHLQKGAKYNTVMGVLEKLQSFKQARESMAHIEEEKQKAIKIKSVSWKELFTTVKHLQRTGVASLTFASMEFTGNQVLIAYSTKIFQAAGMTHYMASYATLGTVIGRVLFTVGPTTLIDRFGRRLFILGGYSLSALSLAACSLCFWLGKDKFWLRYAILVAMIMFSIAYTFSAAGTVVVLPELMLQNLRAKGVVVARLCYYVVALLNSMLFLKLIDVIGLSWMLFIYAMGSTIAGLNVWWFLPETAQTSFSQIAQRRMTWIGRRRDEKIARSQTALPMSNLDPTWDSRRTQTSPAIAHERKTSY